MRIELPGGQWAELRDVDALTGADQDAVFDFYDQLMDAKPAPEPQPDPDNPAVMKEASPRRLTNADGRALRDAVLGVVITAWSYDHLPLPFVAGYRAQLPVKACNALAKAAGPMQDALLGTEDEDEDPKKNGPSPGSDGSTGTSPGSTESPLPAPPAVPSGTPPA